MSAVTFHKNPLKLLTNSDETKFHCGLALGELLAWDKNRGKFVFCTKNKFSHWLDSFLPTAQNTSISTITQKFNEFCKSEQGRLVLLQLNETQIENLNRNMTDLALKTGGQLHDISMEQISIKTKTTRTPLVILSRRKLVEDSDNDNIRQIERTRKAFENRMLSLKRDQYLANLMNSPLNARFQPFNPSQAY